MLVRVEFEILAREGERACGDAVVVREEAGLTLLAVIDALGHGEKAQEVSTRAVDFLNEAKLSSGVEPIMTGLHAALHQTRGACALLCLVGGTDIEGCSVGNVEFRSLRGRYPFALTPGVLGHRLHRPRVFKSELARGERGEPERIVLFSDGISGRFDLRTTSSLSTKDACHAIFSQQRRAHDDATVLVADLERQ